MSEMNKMYCNPLPLEHYQAGRSFLRSTYDGPSYREMADPAILEFEDRFYLFPSAGMLWESADLVDWEFHRIEPFDPGYAPTVVRYGEYLYLSSSWDGSTVWRSRHPHGPWIPMGEESRDEDGNPTRLRDHEGRPVCWGDPCLFADDDGSLYCYCCLRKKITPTSRYPWHLQADEGIIYGVKLRSDDPSRFAEAPVPVLALDPALKWHYSGEANQLRRLRIMEGAHMNKINGRYYLQYSVNGTEFSNYAVGCAIGDAPLGTFANQQHNPILISRRELIKGTGHHSLLQRSNGELWCFYTLLFGNLHPYERRIGMDRAYIDEQGELRIDGPTETPQSLDGRPTGLMPLNINMPCRAISSAPGRDARYAVDRSICTWYQAADTSLPQTLESDLHEVFSCQAVRLIFADVGLDYRQGVLPGPYGWILYGSVDGKDWQILIDYSENRREQHIVFTRFPAADARYVKLEVVRVPPGFTTGVIDFTVFGLFAENQE